VSSEAQKAYRWLLRNTDLTKEDLDGFSEKELVDHYTILKDS
jgi:hypothetical protein